MASQQHPDNHLDNHPDKHSDNHSDLILTVSPSPDGWGEAVGDWVVYLSSDRKPKTVGFNQRQITLLVRWSRSQNLSLSSFRARDMRRYLSLRASGGLSMSGRPISATTRHHDATVARAFFRWACREGYIETNPLADYEIRKPPRPCVRVPSEADVRKLLTSIKDYYRVSSNPDVRFVPDAAREFHRARMYAVILGLVKTGARPSELLAVRTEDYDPQRSQVVFADTKGNEARVLPISSEWSAAVADYLRVRRRHHVNPSGPHLFVSNTGDQLTWNALRHTFDELVKFSGIPRITLYGLRHFAINDMAKNNLLFASNMAGHRDLKTTRNYLHADAAWMSEEYLNIEPLGKDRTMVSRSAERARKKRIV